MKVTVNPQFPNLFVGCQWSLFHITKIRQLPFLLIKKIPFVSVELNRSDSSDALKISSHSRSYSLDFK